MNKDIYIYNSVLSARFGEELIANANCFYSCCIFFKILLAYLLTAMAQNVSLSPGFMDMHIFDTDNMFCKYLV